jgi:DNA-binding MarR family transcriptional regulator
VRAHITTSEYQALAELRHRILLFLKEGDSVARAAGLEPQQYLMLLAIRGLAHGLAPSIRNLAERLALKHHSAVELIDRLEKRGYVKRSRSLEDRRQVLITLQSKGHRILDRVARQRISELRSSGKALVNALDALLHNGKRKVSRRETY